MSTKIDKKEIIQNLGVGTVIAALKTGIDYFSGKKVTFWSFGKMVAIGAAGDMVNDQIKDKSWYPFKP